MSLILSNPHEEVAKGIKGEGIKGLYVLALREAEGLLGKLWERWKGKGEVIVENIHRIEKWLSDVSSIPPIPPHGFIHSKKPYAPVALYNSLLAATHALHSQVSLSLLKETAEALERGVEVDYEKATTIFRNYIALYDALMKSYPFQVAFPEEFVKRAGEAPISIEEGTPIALLIEEEPSLVLISYEGGESPIPIHHIAPSLPKATFTLAPTFYPLPVREEGGATAYIGIVTERYPNYYPTPKDLGEEGGEGRRAGFGYLFAILGGEPELVENAVALYPSREGLVEALTHSRPPFSTPPYSVASILEADPPRAVLDLFTIQGLETILLLALLGGEVVKGEVRVGSLPKEAEGSFFRGFHHPILQNFLRHVLEPREEGLWGLNAPVLAVRDIWFKGKHEWQAYFYISPYLVWHSGEELEKGKEAKGVLRWQPLFP